MTNGLDERFAEVLEDDIVWSRAGGHELFAHLYRPAPAIPLAPSVLVDVHGGAWSANDRMSGALYDRALASMGLTVVAIDFRQGPAYHHPEGSADVVGAVRWVRSRPDLWGGDPRSIGLIGSSSGGHLALLGATTPNAAAHRGTESVDSHGVFIARDDLDASVDYVVGLWPVSDPYFRYRYAKRASLTRLVEGTESYYGDESAMRAASIPRLVIAGDASHLPPALIVQPGEDSNVPVEMTFDLLRAWQSQGAHIEYSYFPEMPHGFGTRPSPQTDDMVRLVRDFIGRHARSSSTQVPPVLSEAMKA